MSPVQYNGGGGSTHTHDGIGGATSLVVGGTNESGATVPVALSAGSIAVGDFATAGFITGQGTDLSPQTIAIGSGVNSGSAPLADAQGAIAIGASNGVAVLGARANGIGSIAIGSGDEIKPGAWANTLNVIAIGTDAAARAADTIAIGAGTLKFSEGAGNVALGARALDANTSGSFNVAMGTDALGSNVLGAGCVAVGDEALFTNNGSDNVAIGSLALRDGTTGSNTALGSRAGYAPAGVSANATITGTRNVFVGQETGQNSATQRNDAVAVGFRALVDGSSAVALGSGAKALHANAVALGDAVLTTNTQQVNIGAKRIFAGCPATVAAGADLINGQVTFSVNQITNVFTITVKYSTGLVRTGDVILV